MSLISNQLPIDFIDDVLYNTCAGQNVRIRHIEAVVRETRAALLLRPLNHVLGLALDELQNSLFRLLTVSSRFHSEKRARCGGVKRDGRRTKHLPTLKLNDSVDFCKIEEALRPKGGRPEHFQIFLHDNSPVGSMLACLWIDGQDGGLDLTEEKSSRSQAVSLTGFIGVDCLAQKNFV